MDDLGNVNSTIIVVGYCIFYSKDEEALVLNGKQMDVIRAPFSG